MYPDQPNNTAQTAPHLPPPLSEDTAAGTLVISAGYGNRAYPLAGVRAEIYAPSEDEEDSWTLYALRQTDESGTAMPLTVPAPDATLSETPGSNVLPFSIVRIRVFREGFAPQEAENVPIFAGIRSLQYFEMVPLSEGETYAPPGGIFTVVADSADNNL